MYKYTTQKSLIEIRGIAERAYTRGSKTCHVNVLALLAILDELKAAEHSVQADGAYCVCENSNFFVSDLGLTCWSCKKPRR